MPTTMDMKRMLARILVEKSYLEGDFTLTSGRKSDYYFDCRQSTLHPEGVLLVGELFFSMAKGMDIQAVAGMTMGADPLVTATSLVARQHNLFWPALIVRKEPKGHGTARAIEGLANVTSGQRILVLEDVVSTGGSVLKACTRVAEAGLIVAAVFCILDREEEGGKDGFAQAGYTLHSIFTRPELVTLARA